MYNTKNTDEKKSAEMKKPANTELADCVMKVIEENRTVIESPHLQKKEIALRADLGAYILYVRGLYGSTIKDAERINQQYDNFITSAGCTRIRTLRHPLAGEWSVYCTKDDMARTESEGLANVIAYNLAREEGMMIAEKLGCQFKDDIKNE